VLLLTAVPLYVATTRTRPHFIAGAINSPSGEPSRASAVAAAPATPAPSTLFAVPAERNARLLDATAVAAMPAMAIARPGLVPPTSAARSDDQSAVDVSSTGANISVVVAATHRSWIIGTANGERVLNRLMEEGEEETITGRDLTVTAGDAGAVAIAVNGAPATPLGRPGQVGTAHINGVHLKKRQQSR
jgi:hypothetical protein